MGRYGHLFSELGVCHLALPCLLSNCALSSQTFLEHTLGFLQAEEFKVFLQHSVEHSWANNSGLVNPVNYNRHCMVINVAFAEDSIKCVTGFEWSTDGR